MQKKRKSETDHLEHARKKILTAALIHVPFDGWSRTALEAGVKDAGIDIALARVAFARGPVDLALYFHRQGDAAMAHVIANGDATNLRYRDRIALAVKIRLTIAADDKESVRKGVVFFALPSHASDGARAVWDTADAIWNCLGDTSSDINWYSKRLTLGAVYSATTLYWLGDETPDHQATWAFLDRRIADVMAFETFKARVKDNQLFQGFMKGPGRVFQNISAPKPRYQSDLPGHVAHK